MSLTTTIKRENLGPVWDKPVPDRWLCFCPNFLSFCWSSLVAFGEFTFQKIVTNQQFGLEFCAVRQDTFYPHQDYEQVNFYKKSSLYFIGWSLRNWKSAAYLHLVKNWNILTEVRQNILLLSTFATSLWCYAKGNWKSRVCAWSKFWIYWFAKKQRYKILANFWRFLWRELQFQKPLLTLPPPRDIEVWAKSTLNTTLSPEQTRKRRWVTKHSHCSLQVSPWCIASNHP